MSFTGGFRIYSPKSGRYYGDQYTSETSTNRIIRLTDDLDFNKIQEFNAQFLAGGNLYVINTQELRRIMTARCRTPTLDTINFLSHEWINANILTIEIGQTSDQLKSQDTEGVERDYVGYIQQMRLRLRGKDYRFDLQVVIK